ncbi:MAG: hypothetical protein ACI9C4_000100 [Paraglaciecola sp.]|jgi:hypothetical protein
MKIKYLVCALLLISSLPLMARDHNKGDHHNRGWQTIPVETEMHINDDEGMDKTINPACAFDTLVNPVDGTPVDNTFRFYYKEGKSDNVLVFFNGGGSCWNDATCVASLALANIPGNRPTYNPSVLQQNSPVGAGGVFDDDNDDNPFKDWNKVFIPYCTGDLHAGSNEVAYTDVDGTITGYPGAPVSVKHHGFDNFMAVREWMKQQFKGKKDKLEKLLVTGSSAGGYGAILNFPYVQSAFPKTKVSLLADASASVVTEGFINDVFTLDKNWNLDESLPPIFSDGLGIYSAAGLNVELFQRLTEAYPKNRFAQYTTAQDFVQVLFLKLMDQLDNGNTNPILWALNETDFLYFKQWNERMTASHDYLSETTDNYQYYIGAGNVHTILTDAFATPGIPHPFYDEQSAQGVKFSDWLARFANARKFRDKSVQYQQ